MLRPGPAVPIERPPTVEEVIDELRARLDYAPASREAALVEAAFAGTVAGTELARLSRSQRD
jgi:hypothetical protein